MLNLNQSIQRAITSVNKYAESWRRHQALWKTDKNSVLDKFKARDPSAAQFEDKLSKYAKVKAPAQGFCSWASTDLCTTCGHGTHIPGFRLAPYPPPAADGHRDLGAGQGL